MSREKIWFDKQKFLATMERLRKALERHDNVMKELRSVFRSLTTEVYQTKITEE